MKSVTRESVQRLTDKSAVPFLKKYGQSHLQDEAIIHTAFGDIKIRLYHNTPLHRANFLFLANQHYYDHTWFYRVTEGHVIQAGNTDSPKTQDERREIGEYHIPAEFVKGNYHKRGTVAEARSYKNNPEKKSDPYEFYIVIGKKYSPAQLRILAKDEGFELTPEKLEFYSNHAGSPHLDGQLTVFGEVVDGMDVVDAISHVKVDEGDWPYKNIPIKIDVLPAH